MGGWSIGFHREGFHCVGVDVVDVAYPYRLILQDIRELDGREYQDFDVIVGSPPCRDFTILQDKHWKEKKNPERGLKLVNTFLRIVGEAEPKYWLMENVWGLCDYLDLKPKTKTNLGRGMRRAFWGDFPPFLITQDFRRKKCVDIGQPFGELRSWLRAKIPFPISQALAKAIKNDMGDLA